MKEEWGRINNLRFCSGIAFTFYNIAKYPEVQQKVFEECRASLGDDLDAPVTMQDLSKLNYLELVIKESLRLFPPVPFFARKMSEEVMIGNIIVPANTSVYIAPYCLGRNPEVYANPLKFDPSRFDVQTTTDKTNPFAYVPFSAGPRNCIGQKFAMLEMKSILSKVVRNFELSISKENEKLELIAALILRPENGIVLDIKKRIYSWGFL
jgi:cytochrome P450 family 4